MILTDARKLPLIYQRPWVEKKEEPLIYQKPWVGEEEEPLISAEKLSKEVTMVNNEWYKEKWATDLMGQIATSVFGPKTQEPPPTTSTIAEKPKTALGLQMGDWVVPVTAIGVVAVVVFVVFLLLRR